MKHKLLFIDTETTGLDPDRNGVVQVAALFENAHFASYHNPIPLGVEIDKEALKINGLKKKKIKKFPTDTLELFIKWMDSHVNKYDKDDKFTVVGYNVKFDLEFLHAWARRENFEFMGSYLDWRVIDVLVLARTAHYLGQLPGEPKDFKLASMCGLYNIKIPDHDALTDIRATRELFYRIIERWV